MSHEIAKIKPTIRNNERPEQMSEAITSFFLAPLLNFYTVELVRCLTNHDLERKHDFEYLCNLLNSALHLKNPSR